MTREPHWCPVDHCEFGETVPRTIDAVRAHTNAESSSGHKWHRLREQVKKQTRGESTVQGGEATVPRAFGSSDGGDRGAATALEINETDGGQSEQSSEDTQDADSSATERNETRESDGVVPRLDSRVFLLVTAVAVAAALYWFVLREDATEATPSESQTDSEDESEEEED